MGLPVPRPRARLSRTLRGRRRGDEGSAFIEVLGIVPLTMLVIGLILELFLIGAGSVRAESDARFAAREASRASSSGSLSAGQMAGIATMVESRSSFWAPTVTIVNGDQTVLTEPALVSTSDSDAVSAKVKVTVPFLGLGLPRGLLDMTLTRHAVMPKTG